jgi:transglutaminase-like putative cysteine protease
VAAAAILTQTVARVDGPAAIRYTLGQPLRFDQAVTTYWRGRDDLSRVEGQGGSYSAVSRVPAASAAELRVASLADAPPALMARYTALPDTVPERVLDLAQQVAGQAATPYDQAKALEAFLRQYPYSLGVQRPPAGRDPVDYFLFEGQSGYCDYYASAMVVLARSLGLPARLAAGYLAPAAVDGVQTIKQIDAHSWAEVYLAGYGWLEFEPTAAFPAESAPPPLAGDPDFAGGGETTAPPIPDAQVGRHGYLWLLALIPLLLVGWWWRRTRRARSRQPGDQATWAYHRLQRRADRLGQAIQPSQTPAEFADAFLAHLERLDRGRLAGRLHLAQLTPEIRQLTQIFAGRQYARQKPPAESAAASWRRVRHQLWLLTLREDLRGLWPFR